MFIFLENNDVMSVCTHTQLKVWVEGGGRRLINSVCFCPTNAMCNLKNNSIGTSPSDSQKSRGKDN